MPEIPAFDIQTPEHFFKKLLDERSDLNASRNQSVRHTLNAILTACHLTDWVWESVKGRSDLHLKWGLGKPDLCHFRDFIEDNTQCPLQAIARAIANGTKHAKIKSVTTKVINGAFDPGGFQADAFQVPQLSIVISDGVTYGVPEFLDELIKFWKEFLTSELDLGVS